MNDNGYDAFDLVKDALDSLRTDIRELRGEIHTIRKLDDESHNVIFDKIEGTKESILTRIEKMETDLSSAKTIIRVFRLIAATVLFLIAFKFGDIKELWTRGV